MLVSDATSSVGDPLELASTARAPDHRTAASDPSNPASTDDSTRSTNASTTTTTIPINAAAAYSCSSAGYHSTDDCSSRLQNHIQQGGGGGGGGELEERSWERFSENSREQGRPNRVDLGEGTVALRALNNSRGHGSRLLEVSTTSGQRRGAGAAGGHGGPGGQIEKGEGAERGRGAVGEYFFQRHEDVFYEHMSVRDLGKVAVIG